MSSTPVAALSWVKSPARGWAGSGLVLVWAGIMGLAGVGAAAYDLWTGEVRGGRPAAAALIPYAAALLGCGVVLIRRRARMWHVAVALVLLTPIQWIDTWLVSPDHSLRVPVVQLALFCWLFVDLIRWLRLATSRGHHREAGGHHGNSTRHRAVPLRRV